MRQFVVMVLAVFGAAETVRAAPLQQRVVSVAPFAIEHVIVGRARCGATTWMLTDPPV